MTDHTTIQKSDGSYIEVPEPKTVAVPVTVPEDVEQTARGRHELDAAQGHNFDFDDPELQLEAYLRDYIDVEPVFLTRHVEHPEYNTPLTHALYSCVSEAHYEMIKAEVDTRPDVTNIQEFVRKAVLDALHRPVTDGGKPATQIPPSVDRFNSDQRTLYGLISSVGEIPAGQLYDRYAEKIDEPKTKRTVRNYLTELEEEGMIESVGKKRGRRYRLPSGVE